MVIPGRARRAILASLALVAAACGASNTLSSPTNPTSPTPTVSPGWLQTAGNRIVTQDGRAWMARGVNIHDTRSCGACTFEEPNRGEVVRRIDEAVGWGATLLRLDLESYGSGDGRVQWRGVLDDAAYLADLQAIVAHAASKPNVYVLISLWTDPTLDENGVPTAETVRVWQRLADAFRNEPRALFGVANEPQANFDGSRDAQVWAAMNAVVSAIRGVEDAGGTPRHVVTVQGTRQWARVLDYYLTHPIEAGGGGNVAYETHVYDPADTFEQRFVDPSRTLPVIIGEFGPIDSPGVATMTFDDCTRLMDQAEALGVPYLAWTFHMRCPPNLLQDLSGGSCGIGMSLVASEWGQILRTRFSKP